MLLSTFSSAAIPFRLEAAEVPRRVFLSPRSTPGRHSNVEYSPSLRSPAPVLISFPVRSYHRGMRRRRDPHDDPAPARSQQPAPAVPTLGALLRPPYWLLLCCSCGHRVAVALVPYVIRWARRRRRTCCAHMHGARSAVGGERRCSFPHGLIRRVGWQAFPVA